ncbi:MAG: hypothetical protein AB7P21_25460 [Lautropia sp.]
MTLYLLPVVTRRLRPQLVRQLREGTRVVSHAFHLGEVWPPEQRERIGNATVYAWTVAPQVKAAG